MTDQPNDAPQPSINRRRFLARAATLSVAGTAGLVLFRNQLALGTTVVDALCVPGQDCTPAIQAAIDEVFAAGGGTVRFGSTPNAVYSVLGEITMRSNVRVEGSNDPVIESGETVVFRADNTVNCQLANFRVRANPVGSITKAALKVTTSFTNLLIDGVHMDPNGGTSTFLQIDGVGSGLTVRGCNVQQVSRFVWIRPVSASNILIEDNDVRDVAHSAVYISGLHTDIEISKNRFLRHFSKPGANTSHMIATDPETAGNGGPVERLQILNNVIEGVEGVAKYRDEQDEWVGNGASGDLIAVRNVDDFSLSGNEIRHSGEVGVTLSSATKNGSVSNNTLSDSDSVGIIVGSNTAGYSPIENVTVNGNTITRFSLDLANELPFHARSGIRVWHANDVAITNNHFDSGPSDGAAVYIVERTPPVVSNITYSGNTFVNNPLGNIVEGNAYVAGTPV